MSTVILDLDGTLVDSVYLHVVCWQEALHAAGHDVPAVRLHAAIGLGSDRLVRQVLGRMVSAEASEELSADHRARFLARAGDLLATPGAVDLLDDLAEREVPFVVATSAGEEERTALLEILGNPEVTVHDADSVESSKPSAEPLLDAVESLGVAPTPRVVMVGDAPWDGHAAAAAGVSFVAVRCGGFPDRVLWSAGASRVHDAPADLVGTL